MKKIILLLTFTQCMLAAQAQRITNYGTSSGAVGIDVCYFGYRAGYKSLANTTENSFFGSSSGRYNVGHYNTGLGAYSLYANTSGSYNTATGDQTLQSCTTGSYNTATGYQALSSLKDGIENIAIGFQAAMKKTSGDDNIAIGTYSQGGNTGGSYNVSIGSSSLYYTNSDYNTAIGYQSLYGSIYGRENCAIGAGAAFQTNGFANTSLGNWSLYNNGEGSYNTAIGYLAGPYDTDLTNTTAIGYNAVPTSSYTVVIGNPEVWQIGGYANWSVLSDGRFKKDIKEDISGLDFINKLRPVSYTIDKEALHKSLGTPDSVLKKSIKARKAPVRQMGFIAQEVEEIVKKTGYTFSGVNAPQNDKDHYSISYTDFVMPLVKAVQELSAKVADQQKKAEDQQKKIDLLLNQLNKNNTLKGNETTVSEVMLFQNAPNPFTAVTEIAMTLPEHAEQVYVIVYTLDGKELKSMPVNSRGKTSVKISANELNAGMYIYVLLVDNEVIDTKRMILTK